MLIQFRFQNFKSFREEMNLKMIPTNSYVAKLDDVKDQILDDLSEEYISKNPDCQIKGPQELRKKYDMDIIDDEIQTQYANYIQNALLQLQSSTSAE